MRGAFSLVFLQLVVLRDEVGLARLDSTFDPLHAWTVIDGKDCAYMRDLLCRHRDEDCRVREQSRSVSNVMW